MKKISFAAVLFFVLIYSCTQIDDPEIVISDELKQIEDYYFLGDIHNEYMLNLELTLDDSQVMAYEEKINHLTEIHIAFSPNDDRMTEGIRSIISVPEFVTTFIDPDELRSFSESDKMTDGIQENFDNGRIDLWEKGLFLEIAALASSSIAFDELNEFLDEKIVEWKNQGYKRNSDEGDVSAAVIAIGKRSTEFWITNIDISIAGRNTNNDRWAFLARDLVGAVAGALVAEILNGVPSIN